MVSSDFYRIQSAVLCVVIALVLIATAVTAADEKTDLQTKINAGSFSRLSHGTGLRQARDRFGSIMRKGESKRERTTHAALFSKNPSSAASTAFINAMVNQFNSDHGMRRSAFILADNYIDGAGNLHIIMSQQIDNVKVKAGKVALHFNKDGDLYDISGQIQDDPAIQTTPQISRDEAVASCKATITGTAELDGTPETAIVGGRLSYIVTLREQDVPGNWEVIVDARSGEVLEKSSTLRFLNPPGWPDNGFYTPITGNIGEHEGGGAVAVNGWHDNTTDQNYLFNNDEHWQITHIVGGEYLSYSNASTDWGTSNRPAMSLAQNFGHIVSFVIDSMGRNCYNNSGATAVVCFFNSGSGYGFWVPSEQVFKLHSGNGGVTQFDFVVLDMVAHEYGHAMTNYASDLIYAGESGALNEGYSDIFGTCVEEAVQNDGRDQYPFNRHSTETTFDWLLGEDMFRIDGERFWCRNMREPQVGGSEGNLPSLYKGDSWYSGTDNSKYVHTNCGLLGFAFYLLSEGVFVESINDPVWQHRYGPFRGLGIGAARKIAWGAQFNGRLPSNADYRTARNAWIATAQELGYDAGLVAQMFAAVGVIDRTVGRPAGTALPTDPANYSTIAEAIDAAADGDLIYVYPGTYDENLTMDIPNLSIVSRNRDLTTINGTVTITAGAYGSTFAGFTVDAGATATGVTINGSSGDPVRTATIGNNTIRNCNTAISLSWTQRNTIINNKLQTGSDGSLVFENSSDNIIMENKIDGGGMFFGISCSGNTVSFNRWNNVTTEGVIFNDVNSGSFMFAMNEFTAIDGSDMVGWIAPGGLVCNRNTFTKAGGPTLNFPAGTVGSFLENTFSSGSYSITAPASLSFNANYWKDYLGQDINNDGLGETDVPHAGIDYSPLMSPRARAINFNYDGTLLMSSTVSGGKFRVAGTAGAGTVEGLKFGNGSALSESGNLIGSQLLANSGRWLGREANFTGGLVFRDAEETPQMHISADGIVRTRDNLSVGY